MPAKGGGGREEGRRKRGGEGEGEGRERESASDSLREKKRDGEEGRDRGYAEWREMWHGNTVKVTVTTSHRV